MANNVARSMLKSGWLWRRTNVLHRWKRNWFVLWSSGRLMFYEDERQLSVEDSLNIPMERPKIFTVDHLQFHHVEPPNDLNPNCLLGLKVKGADEEKIWYMCAESPDEATAWRIAFEEASQITPYPYVGRNQQQDLYPNYPPQSFYIPNYYGPGRHYHLPPGAQVVYIDRRPYYRDPVTGLLSGLVLGSLLFWPWPIHAHFWGCFC